MGTKEQQPTKNTSAMLVICVRGQAVQQLPLQGDTVILGNTKWANTVDIPVDSQIIADTHGKFIRMENGYVFEDISKLDDTFYNDKLLGSDAMDRKFLAPLHDGDVIRIDQRIDGQSHPQATVIIYYKRYDDEIEWRTLDLKNGQDVLHISRHEDMVEGDDEVLENLAELPRHYATLLRENGNWFVEDHNTRFGVEVNNEKITQRRQLYALDIISIGHTHFMYQEGTLFYNHRNSAKNCLVIHIEERSVWNLFRKQILLEDINLSIRPGEMVLILGGSGAGKTTFVNAVMGYEKAKGQIMEGDIDIYRNYNQMKYEIGFVPQQDLLRLEETVLATLENAAELKLPKATTEEERTRRINEVLEQFGLERESASLVGKLSGGQRKRLSIAVEFIADPSLFFLDEPDSGLDGVMARSLMENLRVIADQKKIVLVITHSPDRVADLFDNVIVLAKGTNDNIGKLAFYGSVEEAYDFFETDSLEQVVRRINRPDEGGDGRADEFIAKYKKIEETANE